MDKRSSNSTAVRIILGLLLLHCVVIGGILIHEHIKGDAEKTAKATNAPPSTGVPKKATPQPRSAGTVTQPISTETRLATETTSPINPRDLTPSPVRPDVTVEPEEDGQTITSIVVSEEATPTPTPAQPEEIIAVVDTEIDSLVVRERTNTRRTTPPTEPVKEPSVTTSVVAPEAVVSQPREHLIVSGDVWETVAPKYGVTVAALKKANPKAAARPYLYTGDRLFIPASTDGATTLEEVIAVPEEQPSSAVYVVEEGDTLSSIARRHKMSLAEIIALNKFSQKQANRLRLGQKIQVKAK